MVIQPFQPGAGFDVPESHFEHVLNAFFGWVFDMIADITDYSFVLLYTCVFLHMR